MAKELDLQTNIKKSVRADGGYAIKMSNRFTIGIPDLLVALPPFAPCILEVKDLGECVESFSRQIDVTPKQRLELNRITFPYYEYAIELSGLLVGLKWQGSHLLVALPRHAERLTSAMLGGAYPPIERQVHGYYQIGALLKRLNIARVTSDD